jgi:hypothetical protein
MGQGRLVGLGSGGPRDQLPVEVLEHLELPLTRLGRPCPLGLPGKQRRDDQRQPQEDEQHDDILEPPDHHGPVRREEEEVEQGETDDGCGDAGSQPPQRGSGDHDGHEREALAERCGAVADEQQQEGQRHVSCERHREPGSPPAEADRRRRRQRRGSTGRLVWAAHALVRPLSPVSRRHDPRKPGSGPLGADPHKTQMGPPGILTKTSHPAASLDLEMQDTVLVIATVAFFAAMFLLVKGLDRI